MVIGSHPKASANGNHTPHAGGDRASGKLSPHQAPDHRPVGPVEPEDGIAPVLPAWRLGNALLQHADPAMRLRGSHPDCRATEALVPQPPVVVPQ